MGRRVNIPWIGVEYTMDEGFNILYIFWPPYPRSTKSWWRPWNFRSDDFNLANRNLWFSRFPVSSLSMKSWYEAQSVECNVNWEIYTLYAGVAGMLLHINGKFTMGKLKSSLLCFFCWQQDGPPLANGVLRLSTMVNHPLHLSHRDNIKDTTNTDTSTIETFGSVAFLLALYLWNPYMKQNLWNIMSTERYILHMQVLLECCYI
jgi:hypothetical protein